MPYRSRTTKTVSWHVNTWSSLCGHIPRKRFGQNFLVDPQIVADIVRAIHPGQDDLLVEIGPGWAH